MGISYEPLDPEVAERIDNLFGHKNCLIEVNPGKVLMPPRYEEIGDRIRSLDVRPDDVWVVSYPRTGKPRPSWASPHRFGVAVSNPPPLSFVVSVGASHSHRWLGGKNKKV